MVRRRTYPLLAVALTATFVCVWMLGGSSGPPYCVINDPHSAPPAYILLDLSNASSVPNPYDLSLLEPNDLTTLIDLHNFTLHMNDPVCNSSFPPLYVVIVFSAPTHEKFRRIIRSTWGQSTHLVFLLGQTKITQMQRALEHENKKYHDIVQGSFMDSYRNLTYKHVLALKWVTYHCPGAKYVLKIDDDAFVNTPFLEEFLARDLSAFGARKLVLCVVLTGTKVFRSNGTKWRVSYDEYKDQWYPDYCRGWVILYSPDAVFQLYREAQRSQYFWIDDVHITGILLQKLNLPHTHLGNLTVDEKRIYAMMKGYNEFEDFLFSLIPMFYHHDLWEMVKERANDRTET